MANINLGKAGLNPRGVFNPTTNDYEFLDILYYLGDVPADSGSFVVRIQTGKVPVGTLPTNTTYFLQLTRNGEVGRAFQYSDFTSAQLEDLKVKGDAFTYADFTPEQLASLKGEKGADGNTWHHSTDAPPTALGKIGDYNFNTTTNDVSVKTDPTTWAVIGNLKGATGDKPAHVWTGTKLAFENPDGTMGAAIELKGERGESFTVDESGTLAGRAVYDGQPKGFSYLDVPNGNLYFKNSNAVADWSSPIPFGKGEKGDSAYQTWLDNGNTGSEIDFLNWLKADITALSITNALGYTPADNTALNNLQPKEAGKGLSDNNFTTILKNAYDSAVNWIATNGANLLAHLTNTSNPHGVTAAQVGLGSVNNTPDSAKPISTATQAALNNKADLVGGLVPANQLPSFVDDVLEYPTLQDFPATGESGKIYIASDTEFTYRWTGNAYARLNEGVVLGETASTAYRGDRGKIAYEHSQVAHAPANAQKNSDITKAEIEAKLTGTITSHAHNAAEINESATKRFVTDVEKTAWNGKADNAPLQSTGGSIQFDKERIYGTNASPIAVNLTTNATGATAGVTAKIFHKKTAPAPTMPATWKMAQGSLDYDPTKVNRIYVQYEDASNILYTISYA